MNSKISNNDVINLLKTYIPKTMDIGDFNEIRTVRVFKRHYNYNIIKKTFPAGLVFMSNDCDETSKDYFVYYTLKSNTKSKIVLIGINFQYSNNGLKLENLEYSKNINLVLYKLLISRHDIIHKD